MVCSTKRNQVNEIGIMLLKDTRAKIFDNIIKSNEGIGLYIRDKSHGEIKSNKVRFIILNSKHRFLRTKLS